MRWAKIRHQLRYKIGCSDEEWDKRQAVIAKQRMNGYYVGEVPNPCRLNAGKGGEEFIIDVFDKGVSVVPIKWVVGRTNKRTIVTDIPNTGRSGIWNSESKYYDEIQQLMEGI